MKKTSQQWAANILEILADKKAYLVTEIFIKLGSDHNFIRSTLRRLATTGLIRRLTAPVRYQRTDKPVTNPSNLFEGEVAITPKFKTASGGGVDAATLARVSALETKVATLTGTTTNDDDNAKTMSAMATLAKRISKLEDKAERVNVTLEVKIADDVSVKLKGVTLPKVFKRVVDLAACRRNILLIGPAGCGKTHLGKLVADSLKLEFGSLSCTAGMSESNFLGRGVPNLTTGKTEFQSTEFIKRFEQGGVMLLDEFDAADSNTTLCINSAIANGYIDLPNRSKSPRAERHKDFVLIATANTFGRGANRMYVGRNQLDEATLDRFRIGTVECDYDDAVEAALCPDAILRNALVQIRNNITATGMRRIMSSRFMQDAFLMRKAAKWTVETILDTYFEGWSQEERAKAIQNVKIDAEQN